MPAWPQCRRYLPHVQVCALLVDEYILHIPEVVWLLHQAGWYLFTQAQYGQAESLYQQALAINEKVRGADHLDTAGTLHLLAVLYQDQGKYEEAEPLYLRSITTMEKLLPNHPNTAIVLESYAGFLRKVGREKEAIELEGRARAIREKRGEGG